MNFAILQNLDLVTLGLATAAGVILGYVVYAHNTKSATGRALLIFTIVSSFWGSCNYLGYQLRTEGASIFFLRGEIFFGLMQAFAFFYLTYVFPDETTRLSAPIKKYLIPWVMGVGVFCFTPFVFSGLSAPDVEGVLHAVVSPGILLFAVTAVGLVGAGIYLLIKRTSSAPQAQKVQFKMFLLGMVITFFLIITFNFVFPVIVNDLRFIPYSSVFIFPFIAFTSYAILRHGFLKIKVVSTELLVFSLAAISLAEVLFSADFYTLLFRIAVFVLTLGFGMMLIRSVVREIKQTEALQDLSAQLTRANVQLKKLDEAKSEFLSVASHQLRTPLTAIKGYVSMLREGDFGKMSPEQGNVMKIVFDSSQRLVELIADLLDLSRIESGTMEFNFEAVDLCKIVEGVITEVRPKTEAHDLYLYFDNINRSCPQIRADAEKLRQVVINLIDNAVKYTVKGGVTVRLQRVGDKLRFSVSDTGIGIDPADQGKLFQKFFRADAANEITREGTGLGIYVVQKLVKAQGGEIWFDSAGVNKGTTFYITFDIPQDEIVPERVKMESLF